MSPPFDFKKETIEPSLCLFFSTMNSLEVRTIKKVNIPKNSYAYFQLVYPKIIEVLRLAAANPEIQNEVFPESEFPPEEIAFLVEHAKMMANILYENGYIDKAPFDSINKLDQRFECFEKGEWTIDSMFISTNWQDARTIALKALKELSVDMSIPNLYWYKGKTEEGSKPLKKSDF